MINFTANIEHAKGSKSELYRLVMLKHLAFQKKYLNEDEQYPYFIPLEQFSIEASFNMDITSELDRHEIDCIKSLAGFKAVLKEITHSVTSIFEPKFTMDQAYLDALDEMVEINLVSNNLPFTRNFIADWCPSHFDINAFTQVLTNLLIFKNPFADFKDAKLVESLTKHYANMLNLLNEYTFTPYVLKGVVERTKAFGTISNIDHNMVREVQKQNSIGHAVIINHIDFNLSPEILHQLYSRMCETFVLTEISQFNVIATAMQDVMESGITPNDVDTTVMREYIHKNILICMSKERSVLAEFVNAMTESCGRGAIGLLNNIFSHQFLLTPNNNESSFIEFMPFDSRLEDSENWTKLIFEYLKLIVRIYGFESLNIKDLNSIVLPFVRTLESFRTDRLTFPDYIIKEAIECFLQSTNKSVDFFESASIS